MAPSYHHLQLVILNKFDRNYHRGDVVAFWCDRLSCVLVKRIAAVPGDRAIICDGILYVNDQVSEVFGDSSMFSYAGLLKSEIVLQSGEYLMLGDNAEESKDSRYSEIGLIHESQIYGWVGFKH